MDASFLMPFPAELVLERMGQLIGAAGGTRAAGDAFEHLDDVVDGHALDERRDALRVAVAAAGEMDVGHAAVDDVEVNGARARPLGFVRCHGTPLRYKGPRSTPTRRSEATGPCKSL